MRLLLKLTVIMIALCSSIFIGCQKLNENETVQKLVVKSESAVKQNESAIKQSEPPAKQNEPVIKQSESPAKQNEPTIKQNIADEYKKAAPLPLVQPNKNIPELKGGPENLTRPVKHRSANHVIYCSNNRKVKKVALTFDDGPDAQFTPKILEILKQNNIKATFFIIGVRAKAHPEVVRRIVNEGHTIGNHTWGHPILSKLTTEKLKNEVQKNEQELFQLTGIRTAMFRPPYGSASAQVLDEVSNMGYNIVGWSVDTRDWANTSTSQILSNVSKQTYPGGIILQHCAGGNRQDLSNTVRALPEIVNLLKKQGYKFVTLQELLGIPATK